MEFGGNFKMFFLFFASKGVDQEVIALKEIWLLKVAL